MAGLSTMGVDLTSLTVFAGALGVGVGLGLQGIIKDFASGVSLVFERLVAVGDFVELPNGGRGVVHEIVTALLGLALGGLGFSGIWLWWRRRRTAATARRDAVARPIS